MAYINGKKILTKAIYKEAAPAGTPIEIATSEEMEAVLVADNIGKIYKYVGETNETFTNGNLYQVMEVE